MKRCRKKGIRVLVKRKNSEVVKAFRNEGGLYCIKNSDTFSSIILKPEETLWTDLPIPYAISEGSETRPYRFEKIILQLYIVFNKTGGFL
jgi:hypothetical protein